MPFVTGQRAAEFRSFVIGGAGFIGSHLVDRLLQRGPVTVFDNLSVGQRSFLAAHLETQGTHHPYGLTLVVGDILDLDGLCAAVGEHDAVFHLAANPEARHGLQHTRYDLEQGTIGTYNVLEAMRRRGVPRLIFASSGTVYGDTAAVCGENDLGVLPISLYGASKLAGEALISAFVECFSLQAWIFRFGNVVGPRATHGVILDFLRQLRSGGDELKVLGDGHQAKPYLHVEDCCDGVLYGFDHATAPLNIHNLTPSDSTSVARIAEFCIAASPYPHTLIRYDGGPRGWPGDVPRSRLAASKMQALGFVTRHSSDEAVQRAVSEIAREVF